MAATFADQFQLAQETTFQNRVSAALFSACVAISNEGWGVAFHRERSSFCVQILSSTSFPNPYVVLFSNSVATDPVVIADATQGGTVALTSGNRAAQAALVTDAHISNAIAAMFNSYIREPSS